MFRFSEVSPFLPKFSTASARMRGTPASKTCRVLLVATCFLAYVALALASAKRNKLRVPIKIIKSSQGNNYFSNSNSNTNSNSGNSFNWNQQVASWVAGPVPSREPMPFSGPPALRVLDGQCFSYEDGSYEYRMCPFRNVTQRDRSRVPGSLHVLMGVWRGWVQAADGSFESMIFDDGTACGSGKPRQTLVRMECAETASISSISEPTTCEYRLVFTHSLACDGGLDALPEGAEYQGALGGRGSGEAGVKGKEGEGEGKGDDDGGDDDDAFEYPVMDDAAGPEDVSDSLLSMLQGMASTCPSLVKQTVDQQEVIDRQRETIRDMQECIIALATVISEPAEAAFVDINVCAPFAK